MSDDASPSREDELLEAALESDLLGKAAIYTRLSGPGWLQGAITLGGGSLAGALYLGVIMGYEMMWLQPIAMILGVIMLSAISYVTLSTGERPFHTLKNHISPVLAWGWLIATMMANIVWCLPQFALGTAAVQQNLLPATDTPTGKIVVAVSLLVAASIVVWFYNSGSKGIKAFELILKSMVGIVVLSFFGVVLAMTREGVLDWGRIFAGLIPNPKYLFEPAPAIADSIAYTGPVRSLVDQLGGDHAKGQNHHRVCHGRWHQHDLLVALFDVAQGLGQESIAAWQFTIFRSV